MMISAPVSTKMMKCAPSRVKRRAAGKAESDALLQLCVCAVPVAISSQRKIKSSKHGR